MPQNEEILQIDHDIAWLPRPHESLLVLATHLPPLELISTAFVLAFSEERILQTRLVKRGWDLIGGHIESGESPEEAARREAYEEAGVRLGALHLLGYQHLRLLGARPEAYRYTYPDSYQVFYYAQIISLDDFSPTSEAQERGLFSPAEAEKLPWVQAYKQFYLAALANIRGMNG